MKLVDTFELARHVPRSQGPRVVVTCLINTSDEMGAYGSMIGYVGVPHGVQLDGQQLFFLQIGMLGGPAPVRRFLPHLMDLVLDRKINPGKMFELELPLAEVGDGYRTMDERRAIKTLLRV